MMEIIAWHPGTKTVDSHRFPQQSLINQDQESTAMIRTYMFQDEHSEYQAMLSARNRQGFVIWPASETTKALEEIGAVCEMKLPTGARLFKVYKVKVLGIFPQTAKEYDKVEEGLKLANDAL